MTHDIGVQAGGARVQFACASALAMLVEGHAEVCPLLLRHGGIAALAIMLQNAGAQGQKAAAEALQVSYSYTHSVVLICTHACMNIMMTAGHHAGAEGKQHMLHKFSSGVLNGLQRSLFQVDVLPC